MLIKITEVVHCCTLLRCKVHTLARESVRTFLQIRYISKSLKFQHQRYTDTRLLGLMLVKFS